MKWSKLSVLFISKDVLGLVVTLGFMVKVVEVVFADKVEVVFVGLVTIHIKRTHICNVYVFKPTTLEHFLVFCYLAFGFGRCSFLLNTGSPQIKTYS